VLKWARELAGYRPWDRPGLQTANLVWFRNLTLMLLFPFICISGSSDATDGRPKWARMTASDPPSETASETWLPQKSAERAPGVRALRTGTPV